MNLSSDCKFEANPRICIKNPIESAFWGSSHSVHEPGCSDRRVALLATNRSFGDAKSLCDCLIGFTLRAQKVQSNDLFLESKLSGGNRKRSGPLLLTAAWAIDTHINLRRSLARFGGADWLFAAQKKGAKDLEYVPRCRR